MGEQDAGGAFHDYNVWHSHKAYAPFYDIKHFISPMAFEAISVFSPYFICLRSRFARSDGISGKLVLLCRSHYLLKSGDSPCPSKVMGFTLCFLEGWCWGKGALNWRQGIAAEILIPPPVKFKCGIKPFRADAGHLCGLHAGTREGVCDQPGEGPELLKAFSVPEISRYMFPEGGDSKVGRF